MDDVLLMADNEKDTTKYNSLHSKQIPCSIWRRKEQNNDHEHKQEASRHEISAGLLYIIYDTCTQPK